MNLFGWGFKKFWPLHFDLHKPCIRFVWLFYYNFFLCSSSYSVFKYFKVTVLLKKICLLLPTSV